MKQRFSLLSYCLRDLRYRKKFTLLFIANLSVGLFSFLLVDSIKTSFNDYITSNSKNIATADIVIQSRRMMTAEESRVLTSLHPSQSTARLSRFFSMASTVNTSPTNSNSSLSRLIEVNAVQGPYPLYGQLEVKEITGKKVAWKEAVEVLKREPVTVITKEVETLFGVKPGDAIKIGNRLYEVRYLVEKDVGDRLQISALAYKAYIAEEQIESGILEEKGATIRFRHYLKIPGKSDQELAEEVDKIRALLREEEIRSSGLEIQDPVEKESVNIDFRVRSHNQNSSNLQRVITMVHRYFELITLVTLFLCGVGIFYLFRNFIFSKVKEIAILESLGMRKYQTISTLMLELTLLGVGGLGSAILLFYLSKPLIPLVFGSLLPEGLTIDIQWASFLTTLVIAILGSLLFTFPIVWAAGKIKIITLIRQNLEPKKLLRMTLWSFLPNIVFFYALSVWMGESFSLGTTFSAMFLLSIVIVFLIGAGFWKLFSVFKNSPSFTLSFITRNLYQNRSKGFFYFFAIALSVALISLTPQLEYSLSKEISSPDGMDIPSLFIFEIKTEDLGKLEEMVQEKRGNLQFPSPMISAEIKTVNGERFRRLDDDNDNQERNRRPGRNQVNLTYRSFLSDAETIISGEPLQQEYDGEVAEISIEDEFAERNGFKVGDTIVFSLINVPFTFTGKVVNLRKVRWNSFQPNFFITVQDGVMNQVPQKYVTSVNQISFNDKVSLISQLNAVFPHISVLDVQEIIREILKLIDQFSLLLEVMAGFCLILGFMILFTIINQEIKNQAREINLMKAIGGKFTTLYTLVLGEYALVGFLAVISGLVPGIILNYLLSVYFFERTFSFSPEILIKIFFTVMPGIILVNFIGARKVLMEKPIILLKD